MKNSKLILILLAISFIGLNACKQEGSQDIFESNPKDTQVNIELNTDDKMKYNLNEITVYDGQNIKLTLNHLGELPVTVMGHNFVLKDNDLSLDRFAHIAMRSGNTEYVPTENVLANTSLIGGGESTTIEFTAPAIGTYEYLCTFPGHYTVMSGKLIVK